MESSLYGGSTVFCLFFLKGLIRLLRNKNLLLNECNKLIDSSNLSFFNEMENCVM
jgi:hypothetical protein